MTLPSGRPASSFDDVREPTDQEWELWSLSASLRLWEAVALSCSIEPSSLPVSGLWRTARQGSDAFVFSRRFDAAVSHAISGTLAAKRHSDFPDSWVVEASDFAAWAKSTGIALPAQLRGAFVENTAVAHASAGSWPWGDYETRLLRWVAIAVRRFWVNYDPTDRSTAPTAKVVVPWLLAHQQQMGEKLSDREAKLIAQLVTADDAPSGPR